MANFFTNLFSKRVEKKYAGSVSYGYSNIYGSRILTPTKAMEYYSTVAPLFTAISSIASEIGALNIALYDRAADEFQSEADILSLLRLPNADCVQYEFITQVASFYKLTGNAFVVATGPAHRPPVELYAINPANVNLIVNSNGELDNIHLTSAGKVVQDFTRQEVDGRYRYYSGPDAEIWHMKSFNTRYGTSDPWGLSDLNAILLELEQYYEASIHNLSLLKRGARPSGAIKVDESLTDDQFQRLQQQMESFYSGSQNAGRAMIIESGDFIEMSQSNKDMDFATLKKDITSTIYNALKIPLPLVSGENSSYNNMEIAKLNFYDNCIIPTATRILEELSVFLLPRFGVLDDMMELAFISDDVDAMEPRRNQELLKLKDSGVLTVNELRAKLGYDPLDGGDTLYIPSNLMPIDNTNDLSADLYKSLNEVMENGNNKQKCHHNMKK